MVLGVWQITIENQFVSIDDFEFKEINCGVPKVLS